MKKIYLVLLCACITLSSCTKIPTVFSALNPFDPDNMNIESVVVNKSNTILLAGSTEQLFVIVKPLTIPLESVEWSTSNSEIATVSKSGLVTGVASGSTAITATVDYMTATCIVTVSSTAVSVTGVTISQATASMIVGNTLTLFSAISPVEATNRNVTWSSSDTRVATISPGGAVTGIADGTATITATTSDGGLTATCKVTVTSTAVSVTGVIISQPTASIVVGSTLNLFSTISPSGATNQNVKWSSSNTAAAAVSQGGVVTGVGVGTATITVTAADGGFPATCIMNVTATANGLSFGIWDTSNWDECLFGE